MTSAGERVHAEPFFLEAVAGKRFCLYHPPAASCRGAILYVHPFAEEMNRARRLAATHARALAELGYGVLQVDLYGCGDSSGEFGDARWEIWKQDLADASAWLQARLGQPVALWGVRLGALLALDYARTAVLQVPRLVLWQPVHNGAAFLNQFLRLRVAGDMLAGKSEHGGTVALRTALAGGEVLEIAGYDLAPELAAALDAATALAPPPQGCGVNWFEIAATPGLAASPAVVAVLKNWGMHGVDAELEVIGGQPFWTTQDNVDCDALLSATAAVWRELAHA